MESMTEAGSCPRCGAGKRKRWSELDEDEKAVASRKCGERDGVRPGAEWFCARCLSPLQESDTDSAAESA